MIMSVKLDAEKLAKALEDPLLGKYMESYFPVLLPQKYPDQPFKLGVGSPFIVQDPETLGKKMLFIGWNTGGGDDRRVFLCDIDDSLRLSNFRQLLTGADIGGDNVYPVHAMYDLFNEQWIVGLSRRAAGVWTSGYLTYNRTFTTRSSYTPLVTSKDCGLSIVPCGSRRALLTTIPTGIPSPHLYDFPDYTVRPLPTSVTDYGYICRDGGNDIHQTLVMNGQLMVLHEDLACNFLWRLRLALAPDFYEYDGTTYCYRNIIAPTSINPIIPIGEASGVGHCGMMHLTTLFNIPVLFWSWFRNWMAGVTTMGFRHEIWGVRLPRTFFTPESLAPFRICLLDAAGTSKWMPTFCRPTTIFIKADAAGTTNIREARDVYEGMQGNYVTTAITHASAEMKKQTIERPAPWIQVNTTMAGIVWAFIH